MTRTARRDLAAGLTRTSTRRAALVGLLGLGLVAGSIPVLAGDQQGAAGKAKKAGNAKPKAGKAKPKAGETKPAASQVTAASEVSTSVSEVTAAGKFKTVTRTFSFDGLIGIDDLGPAKQYPASIAVSGFKRGRIKDVNVRIPNFVHDFPRDVDLLLVGPQGQQAIIFSDVGGTTGSSTRDVTLDDEATQVLTANDALVSGTFKPTNGDGVDVFPPQAPAIKATTGSALSVFDGTNPNGKWQLFLVDDGADNVGGFLAPGWTITITARVRR